MTTIEAARTVGTFAAVLVPDDFDDGPCPDWCDQLPKDHPEPGSEDLRFHVHYFGELGIEVVVDPNRGPMLSGPNILEYTDPDELEQLARDLVEGAVLVRRLRTEMSA